MPRANLKEQGKIDYWYLTPKFKSEEDAKAAAELLNGLCENNLIVFPHRRKVFSLTITGATVLECFKLPNRSVHIEDIQALFQERHFAASTVQKVLDGLCKEGILYKLGPGTYAKRNDPTPSVCANHNVATPVDGEPAGLDLGASCGCGCGDEGHSSS